MSTEPPTATQQSNGRTDEVDYSIVVPVYFNEGLLIPTMEGLLQHVVEKNSERTGEVIFVDDGSGDGSFNELLKIREAHPGLVRIIKLTRNFGQVNAMLAGFKHCRGRCVAAISADGQDPPELISEMLKAHFNENYEVVLCTREARDESLYRTLTSKAFYSIMRKLSFPSMPQGGFDFFLLGRRALQTILNNYEAHGFLQGQILWTGFKVKTIPYRRRERAVGKSRWTFGKKTTYLIDGVMSYSFFPIRAMSILGALVAMTGFLYAVLIFVIRIFWGHPVEGWTALMVAVLVLSGTQVLMLGIVGEYLWRVLAQARNRDPYVIENIYD